MHSCRMPCLNLFLDIYCNPSLLELIDQRSGKSLPIARLPNAVREWHMACSLSRTWSMAKPILRPPPPGDGWSEGQIALAEARFRLERERIFTGAFRCPAVEPRWSGPWRSDYHTLQP